MRLEPIICDQMLQAVPSLRAFAVSLSQDVDRADDLVQETLLRAIAKIDLFKPGTSMPVWLTTILRNLFYSQYRKQKREVEDADGVHSEPLKAYPGQVSHIQFIEFTEALSKLVTNKRSKGFHPRVCVITKRGRVICLVPARVRIDFGDA